jgi:hypothetical protein
MIKDLLDHCAKLGVIVAPGEGTIRVSPPGVLPDALRSTMREHKEALMAYLQNPPPQRGCYTCQQRVFWRHGETYRWVCATCHPAPHVEFIEEMHEAPEPAPPWVGVLARGCPQVDTSMDTNHA